MKKIFKWVIVHMMIVASAIVFVCNRKKWNRRSENEG